MGHFSKVVEQEITFDGDLLKIKMRRMKNKHMLHIGPALSEPFEKSSGGLLLRTSKLVDVAKEPLAECVTELSGLKDADGNALEFKDILEESYFLPLLDQILGMLIQVSVMSEVDAKKSAAVQPEVSSGESASPTTLEAS